jgi:hypothetical protein
VKLIQGSCFTVKTLSIAAGILVATATVVVCFVIPAKCVISVGDDASAVRAVEIYGYPKSHFSLASKAAGFETPMTPVAFSLGDGWHLLVWHDDRVRRLVHFQYVSRGEHRYGDWIQTRQAKSFEVPRPGLLWYVVGLGVSFGLGWAAHRFRRSYRVAVRILLLLVVLGNVAVGCLAESAALFPISVSLGWIAAFLLGANALQSPQVTASVSPQSKLAEQSTPATAQR